MQSRVQMMLFKAHERARAEFDQALKTAGLTLDQARRLADRDRVARRALHRPEHIVTGTGANQVLELARRQQPVARRIQSLVRRPKALVGAH